MNYNEYDLIKFGTKLKQLRKQLKLTQIQVSDLAEISVDTYSEAERGKRLLSIPTYNQLSQVFKYDLLMLLSNQYKYENAKEIVSFEKRLNQISYEGSQDTVESVKEDIKIYIENSKAWLPDVVNKKLLQLMLLCDTIKIINKTELSSVYELEDLCLEGIKLTYPEFNSYHFKASENLLRTEIRLIINLSIAKYLQGKTALSFEIMENIIQSLRLKLEFDSSLNQLLQQAYCNYAKFLFLQKSYLQCEQTCDLGIKLDPFTRNTNILRLFYFSKGISQYLNHNKDYVFNLKRVFELTDENEDCTIYSELSLSLKKNCDLAVDDISKISR